MTVTLDRDPARVRTGARNPGRPDQPTIKARFLAKSATAVAIDGADDRVRDLLRRMCALPRTSPQRAATRSEAISECLPMADYLARRYRNRGEPIDDLVQVATIGLIKAIDGYDPGRGVAFGSYAVPTIVGELKRHFRDKGWLIRVPRRLQELRIEIARASGVLTQKLGRAPTVHDIAEHLGERDEDVLAGLECGPAYRALSLQIPIGDDESAPDLAAVLGDVDPELEAVEQREALRPLLARLPRREQQILAMRFFGNMTQSQIAAEIGVSQMHVSRLISQSLRALREGLLAG